MVLTAQLRLGFLPSSPLAGAASFLVQLLLLFTWEVLLTLRTDGDAPSPEATLTTRGVCDVCALGLG